MNMPSVAKALLVATFAWWGTQQLVRASRRRAQVMRDRKAQPLQMWEGEGGAVPVSSHRTAADVTPASRDGA